jgi:heme-degrading monooxygenase HmoA
MNSAGEQVREDNRRTHFDMQAMMAQWGVTASIGAYRMLPDSSQAIGALLEADPNLRFRIDAFSVPAASRSEFDAAMHDSTVLLDKLAGFNGHAVFEKTSGPTTFNVVTVAVWDSEQAMRSAGDKVREDYQRKGFDMLGAIARWGVTASLGGYRAPVGLQ